MALDKEHRHLQEQQSERARDSVPRPPVTSEFLDAMSQTELKNIILDLVDQVRDLNARLADKDRANMEKDRIYAYLSEKLDAIMKNQKQNKVDFDGSDEDVNIAAAADKDVKPEGGRRT